MKNRYDSGIYRLTIVARGGKPNTAMFKSWAKCRAAYTEAVKTEPLYVVIVDQTDMNEAYWAVREEYTRPRD